MDCLISTQEQRPIENGTANVFLTSALTPRTAAIFALFTRFSTFSRTVRVLNLMVWRRCIPFSKRLIKQCCYDFSSYVREERVCCCLRSVLRFLNLKRFPRTRAQVGEGWRRPRCKLHRHSHPRLTPGPLPVYCSSRACVSVFRVNCCAEARGFHSCELRRCTQRSQYFAAAICRFLFCGRRRPNKGFWISNMTLRISFQFLGIRTCRHTVLH